MNLASGQIEFFDSLQRAFSRSESKPWILVIGLMVAMIIIVCALALGWVYNNRYSLFREFYYFLDSLQQKNKTNSSRKKAQFTVLVFTKNTAEIIAKAETIDLSQNGMFLKLFSPLELNTEFDFEIKLNEDSKIIGSAKVRWVQKTWNKHYPTGMGCQFLDLHEEDRQKINKILRARRASRFKGV